MPEASPAKVCVKCASDVSAKPRVKDDKGRYLCRPCFDAVAPQRRGAPARSTPQPPPAAGPDDPIRIDGIHDNPDAASINPAPDPDDNALIFDIAPVGGGPGTQGGPCPSCGHFLAAGVKICVNCGFNSLTGQNLGTSVGVEKVKTTRQDLRDDHLKRTSRDVERRAYINAISVITFGVVGTLVALGTLTDDFAGYAALFGLTLAICIPASFLAFYIFGLLGYAGGVGFWLILLEVAAVCCGFMPLFVLELLFPMPRYMRYGLRALVLGGLSYWLLDMEEPANYVFAFVVFVLMIGSTIASAVIIGG